MNILIDTNVALDIALKRPNFFKTSKEAVQNAILHSHRLFFLSSSVTDYYYILKKNKISKENAIKSIKNLALYTSFVSVDETTIFQALQSHISDFEDAIIDVTATNIKADIILTRNKKDFINSNNKVLTPEEFLSL